MPTKKKAPAQTVGDVYPRMILQLLFVVVMNEVIDKIMKLRVTERKRKKPTAGNKVFGGAKLTPKT